MNLPREISHCAHSHRSMAWTKGSSACFRLRARLRSAVFLLRIGSMQRSRQHMTRLLAIFSSQHPPARHTPMEEGAVLGLCVFLACLWHRKGELFLEARRLFAHGRASRATRSLPFFFPTPGHQRAPRCMCMKISGRKRFRLCALLFSHFWPVLVPFLGRKHGRI